MIQPVPVLWPGETVVCIAGGPSLTKEDVEYCRGRARVIAINDAYKLAPWADVLFACDSKWWTWHKGVPSFTGPKYALTPGANKWPGVSVLRDKGVEGLSTDRAALCNGRNSGYQAIGLARHFGAKRILLLGYDMKAGPRGEIHWFGDHPKGTMAPPFVDFLKAFKTIKNPLRMEGISVVNCSRRTALETFPKMTIQEALPAMELSATG